MEKEKKIEEAKQVFRKMLVDEYSIKSADQFFSTEGEAMAEICLLYTSDAADE